MSGYSSGDSGYSLHNGQGALTNEEIMLLGLTGKKPNQMEFQKSLVKYIRLCGKYIDLLKKGIFSFSYDGEDHLPDAVISACEGLEGFGEEYFMDEMGDEVSALEEQLVRLRTAYGDYNSGVRHGQDQTSIEYRDRYAGSGGELDDFRFDPSSPAYNPFPGDGGTVNRPSPRPSADGGSPSGGSSNFPSQG